MIRVPRSFDQYKQGLIGTCRVAYIMENRILFLKQHPRMPAFLHHTVVQHHYAVIVSSGPKPMGDGDECCI